MPLYKCDLKILLNSEIDKKILLKYLIQIANGIKHLHEHEIIHRDLKPDNIFVTEDDILKIGDFGLSMVELNFEQSKSICGTLYGTRSFIKKI